MRQRILVSDVPCKKIDCQGKSVHFSKERYDEGEIYSSRSFFNSSSEGQEE